MNDEHLTITQLAHITGLTTYTLRYYEDIGLMPNVGRYANGRRYYVAWHISWLEFVLRMRSTGMSLPDLIQYGELLTNGEDTVQARLAILEDHHTVLEQQLDEMLCNLQVLRDKISLYKAKHGLPMPTEAPHPWQLQFRPDAPVQTCATLPTVLEHYLAAPSLKHGMTWLDHSAHGWQWAGRYRFLADLGVWYAALPDWQWQFSHIERQADTYRWQMGGRGTFTEAITLWIDDQWHEVSPTHTPLELAPVVTMARLQGDKIAEFSSPYNQHLLEYLKPFVVQQSSS